MGDKPEFVVVAEKFFEACETGKGSAATSDYTSEGATFSGQVVADAFKGIETLSAYADWMNGLANGIMPGCSYTLHSLTWNSSKQVVFFATFHGKHTGDKGPCPATQKETNSHYVYVLQLNDANKITSMTKVWNNAYAFGQLGWC